MLLLVISPSGRTYTRRAQLDEITRYYYMALPKPVAVAAAEDASELGETWTPRSLTGKYGQLSGRRRSGSA